VHLTPLASKRLHMPSHSLGKLDRNECVLILISTSTCSTLADGWFAVPSTRHSEHSGPFRVQLARSFEKIFVLSRWPRMGG
jgi:hypothetical protein